MLHPHRNRHRFGIALFVVALGSACGGGGDDDSSADSGLSVEDADLTVVGEDIEFTRTAYTADAGELTVALVNEGVLPHTLVIEDVDGFKLSTGQGDEDVDRVSLEAGEYVIYCDVPGHRAEGMEATLTVE